MIKNRYILERHSTVFENFSIRHIDPGEADIIDEVIINSFLKNTIFLEGYLCRKGANSMYSCIGQETFQQTDGKLCHHKKVSSCS